MIGEQVRKTREKLGLNQAEFASLLGVHAVTLCRYERDKIEVPAFQLGLAETFRDAAGDPAARDKLRSALARSGPIAGIRLLLNLAAANARGTNRRRGEGK